MPGRTIQVAVAGNSPVETFVLPPNLAPFVDSVYAEIDNTAGADATPVLTLAGPGNRTVAQKGQSAVAPAGDLSSATWALRLAGDGAAAPTYTVIDAIMLLDPGSSPITATAEQSLIVPLKAGLNLAPVISLTAVWTVAANDRLYPSIIDFADSGGTAQIGTSQVQRLDAAGQEIIGGPVITVDSSQPTLPISHGAGAALLDVTNPTNTLFVNAGTYAVTLNIVYYPA